MILTRLYVLKTESGEILIDAFKGNVSKDKMTEIISEYIESICSNASLEDIKDMQQQFVSYSAADEIKALEALVDSAKMYDNMIPASGNNELPLQGVRLNKGLIPEQWDSDELITFEEVYKYERGTEYSANAIEQYTISRLEMETVINAQNKKQQFVDFTEDLRKKDISSIEKEKMLLEGFAQFYALSDDGGLSELQKIIDISGMPVTIENGKLNINAETETERTAILNYLLKIAGEEKEKQFKTFLHGKSIEEYQTDFEEASNNALGKENSKLLAEAMLNDNLGMIKRYPNGVSLAGMGLTIVGGALCFTPAAPAGAALITAGNTLAIGGMVAKTGLGSYDYATKEVQTPEELEELAKDFVLDAGRSIFHTNLAR